MGLLQNPQVDGLIPCGYLKVIKSTSGWVYQ